MLTYGGQKNTCYTIACFNNITKNYMSSVNGQSVREEAERIKSEFDRIARNKKIDNESKILFQSMLMLIKSNPMGTAGHPI